MINESPLFFAIENGNVEAVELLLAHPDIDVNYRNISKHFFFIQFKINYFLHDFILYILIELYVKSLHPVFNMIIFNTILILIV